MTAWMDTKDLLLQVLQQGYQNYGFGIKPLDAPPADNQHPTISFYRAMGQQTLKRPVVTVRRQSGSARSAWLGNRGYQAGNGGSPSSLQTISVIPTEETFRIQFEALQDTGGMPLIDWLVELASQILLQAYDSLTFPVETGGYGLYFPSWRIGQDTEQPFTEVAGKIVFSQTLDFTATRLVSVAPPVPIASVGGFVLDLSVETLDGIVTHIGQIG